MPQQKSNQKEKPSAKSHGKPDISMALALSAHISKLVREQDNVFDGIKGMLLEDGDWSDVEGALVVLEQLGAEIWMLNRCVMSILRGDRIPFTSPSDLQKVLAAVRAGDQRRHSWWHSSQRKPNRKSKGSTKGTPPAQE